MRSSIARKPANTRMLKIMVITSRYLSRISRACFPNILMTVATKKKRAPRPIDEASMSVVSGTEQTPAAIVNILNGIGVNADKMSQRKAFC